MTNRIKDIVTSIVFIVIVGAMFVLCLALPKNATSESERRPLEQLPEFPSKEIEKAESLGEISGALAGMFGDFSKYASDQIPFRDEFRGIKGVINNYVLLRGDNNGFYKHGDFIAKTSSEINEKNIGNVTAILNAIYDKVLKDKELDINVAVIPDKNHYLYEESGHPGTDFEELTELFSSKLTFVSEDDVIDVEALLEIGDYYYTDTHWRQERILDVAEAIVNGFGKEYVESGYSAIKLEGFKGVYAGQSALPCKAEDLYYLTSDTLKGCTVDYLALTDGDNVMYAIDEFNGLDPYNVFLRGRQGIIVIENPANTSGDELFIIRDSFGASLSPLLVESYSKVTVLDLRDFKTSLLTQGLVDFTEGSDMLIILSSLALNEDTSFDPTITQ